MRFDNCRPAAIEDIPKLAKLYDDLNDALAAGTNYPGWIKGFYPVMETAEHGLQEGNLFVCEVDGELAGSCILNHHPEDAYYGAKWLADLENSQYYVVHTLVVHPRYMHNGIGQKLMAFAHQYAKENGIKSIRLDVYEHNIPAIRLYEKCGYTHTDTVDLGLGRYGLERFRLYEMLVD